VSSSLIFILDVSASASPQVKDRSAAYSANQSLNSTGTDLNRSSSIIAGYEDPSASVTPKARPKITIPQYSQETGKICYVLK